MGTNLNLGIKGLHLVGQALDLISLLPDEVDQVVDLGIHRLL